MRKSARALIIQNKKLLLVGNNELDMLWSPGGGIENESALDALKRELQEELGAELKSATHYVNEIYEDPAGKDDRDMQYFLVEIDGEPTPNNEVKSLYWYSRADHEAGTPKISPTIGRTIVPRLIEDGLL